MRIEWRLLHSILLIGIIFIGISGYYFGYRTLISPLKDEVNQLDNLLEIQGNIIGNSTTDNTDEALANSSSIQALLPIQKSVDQILLTIEEIENKSNSIVSSYVIESGTLTQENLPNTIQTLTFQLQVSSPNYKSMHSFLECLTNMERIATIGEVSFGEGTNYNVSFTTYYNPEFSSLVGEAPAFEFESSAQKTTPFQ